MRPLGREPRVRSLGQRVGLLLTYLWVLRLLNTALKVVDKVFNGL